VFTALGSLGGATFIPRSARCSGNVGLRCYRGHHLIGFVLVPVGPNCQFSAGREVAGQQPGDG
jgi:hypothetical protein